MPKLDWPKQNKENLKRNRGIEAAKSGIVGEHKEDRSSPSSGLQLQIEKSLKKGRRKTKKSKLPPLAQEQALRMSPDAQANQLAKNHFEKRTKRRQRSKK